MIEQSKEELQRLRDIPITIILNLKDSTRQQNIICPFHGDTSPSMTIYPKSNSYYCFGCSCSGQGAIDFLLESGCSFQEAIKELKNI